MSDRASMVIRFGALPRGRGMYGYYRSIGNDVTPTPCWLPVRWYTLWRVDDVSTILLACLFLACFTAIRRKSRRCFFVAGDECSCIGLICARNTCKRKEVMDNGFARLLMRLGLSVFERVGDVCEER